MDDTISRQAAIDAVLDSLPNDEYWNKQVKKAISALPSAQPDIVEKILAAGKKGKEVKIYISGRLFAIRELAQ